MDEIRTLPGPRASPVRLWAACGLAWCAACSPPEPEPIGDSTVRDSTEVRVATIHAAPGDLPEWRMGDPLLSIRGGEDGSPHFESVSDALWLSDGRTLVVDAGALRLHLFDARGAYLESYGRRGEGPGEFQRLEMRRHRMVTLTPHDTVVVFDPARRALHFFHPDAGFARTERAPDPDDGASIQAMWPYGDDRLVRHSVRYRRDDLAPGGGGIQRRAQTTRLELLDRGGSPLTEPVEFQGGYTALVQEGEVVQPFANTPFVAAERGRVVFGSGRDFHLTVMDSTFAPTLDVRWPAIREPLPAEEIDELRRAYSGGSEATDDPVLRAMFSDELLPEHRPALSRALFDSEGRIWVARFEPLPKLRDETEWYVLDPSGRPLARVRMPERSILAAAGDDRVLVVSRDSLDVPRVEVLPLETR